MALTKIDDRGLKTPIDLLDSEKIRFGTGNDLEIYHSGSHSYVTNITNSLIIESGTTVLRSASQENYLVGTLNGSVDLYYDNTKRFETTSTGSTVTGVLNITGGELFLGTADSSSGHINAYENMTFNIDTDNDDTNRTFKFLYNGASGSGTTILELNESGNVHIPNDSAKLQLGASQDLKLYHDGTDSYIKNDTGNLFIRNIAGNEIKIQALAGEQSIVAKPDGAVELYYDNEKKLETQSGGVTITGNANFVDNHKAVFGAGSDLKIYHNGTQNIVGDTATQLRLISDAIRLRTHTDSETYLEGDVGGAVKIYHNNFQSFETMANGIKVIGPEGTNANIALWADDGDDDADKWMLQSLSTGGFNLANTASGNWESSLKAFGDGAVELYYNNSKKLETDSSGIDVIKQVTCYSDNNKDEGEIKINARGSSEDDDLVWIGCRDSNTSSYNWQVSGVGNIFASGSNMIGRMRDSSANPTDTYRNADFLRFQSYQGINDGTGYKARCLMGTANDDWDDRRIFYYVDSQSDTTVADFDQDQTISISGSGRINCRKAIWAGRVESDEGGPNSVYAQLETGIIAYADDGSDQTYIHSRNVADSSFVIYSEVNNEANFSVEANGETKADETDNLSNADYAETFEWTDGNTSNQERRGMTVVLDGEKVKLATDSDNKDNIIGVVSPNPAVLGDSASLGWHGRYKRDIYGTPITKEQEWLIWRKEYTYIDGVKTLCSQPDPTNPKSLEHGDVERIKVEDIEKFKAKNEIPAFALTNNIRYKTYGKDIDTTTYDPTRAYIPRKNRKEWDAIGMVGKLVVRRGQPVGTRWLLMKENIGTDTDGTVLDRYLVR